jgi:uncharacterized protein YjbI with pentapeptide repeats
MRPVSRALGHCNSAALPHARARRSNFTSADARKANFKGSNLQGAYFIKVSTRKGSLVP